VKLHYYRVGAIPVYADAEIGVVLTR